MCRWKSFWTFFIILIGVLAITGKVAGHAHVWIHSSMIFYFDNDGMAGFKLEWAFDEMFSNMIIHDFDRNQNNELEPSEVEEVYKGAFSNLKEYEYFTHVKIDNREFTVRFVKDFNAKIVDNVVVYHFFVPCHVKAISAFKEIRIAVYDDSFYTNITLMEDLILFENDEGYEHNHHVALNRDEAYYFGQVYPKEVVLKFKR